MSIYHYPATIGDQREQLMTTLALHMIFMSLPSITNIYIYISIYLYFYYLSGQRAVDDFSTHVPHLTIFMLLLSLFVTIFCRRSEGAVDDYSWTACYLPEW